MSRIKVEAQSEPKLLGEAEVHWKIKGWTGPLARLVRSKAECFVKIPISGNHLPDLQLRFHLKSIHRSQETEQNYCEKFTSLSTTSAFCHSSTMLMVDAPSGPDNLALLVSVNKLDEKFLFGPRENLLIVDNKSGYSELPVMEWAEGSTDKNKAMDALIQLNVSVYQVISTGTAPKNEEQWIQEDWTKSVPGENNNENSTCDVGSNVILKTEDGMRIHARRSILIDKSGFFQYNLTIATSNEIYVAVECEVLLLLLQWMYTGKIIAQKEALCYFGEICGAAKALGMNPQFWSWLEANLWDFFQPENTDKFLKVVEKHNLVLPADLKSQIEFVQKCVLEKKMTYDIGNTWKFGKRWEMLTGILENVNFLTVEMDTKQPISTDCAHNNIISETSQPSLTVEPDPPSQENVQPTSCPQSTRAKTAADASSESDLDLSFKVIDKESCSSQGVESDNDSNLSSYEIVQTKENKAGKVEDIQTLGTELANLLERFNKLAHPE